MVPSMRFFLTITYTTLRHQERGKSGVGRVCAKDRCCIGGVEGIEQHTPPLPLRGVPQVQKRYVRITMVSMEPDVSAIAASTHSA